MGKNKTTKAAVILKPLPYGNMCQIRCQRSMRTKRPIKQTLRLISAHMRPLHCYQTCFFQRCHPSSESKLGHNLRTLNFVGFNRVQFVSVEFQLRALADCNDGTIDTCPKRYKVCKDHRVPGSAYTTAQPHEPYRKCASPLEFRFS